MGGKLVEDKGYFSKFVSIDPFQHQLPVSGDKDVLLFLVQGEYLSYGKFYGLCLRRKGGGQRALPESAVSQATLPQNNQYAKVAYFGVAHPEPFRDISGGKNGEIK